MRWKLDAAAQCVCLALITLYSFRFAKRRPLGPLKAGLLTAALCGLRVCAGWFLGPLDTLPTAALTAGFCIALYAHNPMRSAAWAVETTVLSSLARALLRPIADEIRFGLGKAAVGTLFAGFIALCLFTLRPPDQEGRGDSDNDAAVIIGVMIIAEVMLLLILSNGPPMRRASMIAVTLAAAMSAAELHIRRAFERLAIQADEAQPRQNPDEAIRLEHDLANHLTVVVGYCELGDIMGMRQYIKRLNLLLGGTRRIMGLPALDYLLDAKVRLAENRGTRFMSKIVIPQPFPLSDVEACVLFGNLFDNALEALEKVRANERRFISLHSRVRNGLWVITLRNSAIDGSYHVFGRVLTTKTGPGAYGIGTAQITRIAAGHGGDASFRHRRKVFTATVTLPLNRMAAESAPAMEEAKNAATA